MGLSYTNLRASHPVGGVLIADDDEIGHYACLFHDGLSVPPTVTQERFDLAITFVGSTTDTCIVSFPKPSMTWLRYILALLLNSGKVRSEKFMREHVIWPELQDFTKERLEPSSVQLILGWLVTNRNDNILN
ncbi:unnamed protein product [Didymodactylos carnosus]|uniref:Uncharacterized protein n=1 Tax=Didymodactylos carnosus TaxID=1234261 RepID=A0A814C347_9BILA|nr:unnamed protein product [Didymodactylos carnosus]CAF3715355.1 unnamed protein product [Didymodactylos carnosus]